MSPIRWLNRKMSHRARHAHTASAPPQRHHSTGMTFDYLPAEAYRALLLLNASPSGCHQLSALPTMTWFRSLLRTANTPQATPSPASRRRFFAGAGAIAGSALLADSALAGDATGLMIEPGTLVNAQGRHLDREPTTSDPFIGQILMVGFGFAPRGWAFCDGQLLPISQNQALFSLLGTTFGGDGRTTFALPDLRGRSAFHPGNGPGLSDMRWGEKGGTETETLTANQIPAHMHAAPQVQVRGDGTEAVGLTTGGDRGTVATASTGGGQPVNNMPPFVGINHVIALVGIFPSRS